MHQQDKSQPLTIQFGRELDVFLAKLVTKGIVLAAVVAIIAVVQILINGITNRIVLAICRVSEFGRAIDEGRIQIQKAT